MTAMGAFLAMGGYAAYVWPAYGVAAVVMLVLLVVSRRGWLANEAALRALQQQGVSRRRRRPTGTESGNMAPARDDRTATEAPRSEVIRRDA